MDDRSKWVFAEVVGEGDLTVLLLDGAGGVTAGIYLDTLGRDVSAEIGLALGAIGAEGSQAMRHLPLGTWRAISCECADANLAIGPSEGNDVVVVAAAPAIPMGWWDGEKMPQVLRRVELPKPLFQIGIPVPRYIHRNRRPRAVSQSRSLPREYTFPILCRAS